MCVKFRRTKGWLKNGGKKKEFRGCGKKTDMNPKHMRSHDWEPEVTLAAVLNVSSAALFRRKRVQ